MLDFLDWLARAGGVALFLLTLLGFMFREKWKQLLQRSLASDLERLKSELVKSQAEHAASLAPQLEEIKHSFQERMEAYKVSLIAQAEALRARGDVRKAIALKFVEIEFDRLVALERALGPTASSTLAAASMPATMRSGDQVTSALARMTALMETTDAAEMFVSLEDRIELIGLRIAFMKILSDHVGPGKPVLAITEAEKVALLSRASTAHGKLIIQIRSIAALDTSPA